MEYNSNWQRKIIKSRILIFTFLILLNSQSCHKNREDYSIKIDKEMWKTEPINADAVFDQKYLKDGNLYLDFQSFFFQDTVNIKINNELYGSFGLTTEQSTGLAEVIVIPDFNNIETVSIAINNGKTATVEVDSLNQIIVRFNNSQLFVGFRKHVTYND